MFVILNDMVRGHARHRGMSSADWARAAFGATHHNVATPRLGPDPMAMARQADPMAAASSKATAPDLQGQARRAQMPGALDNEPTPKRKGRPSRQDTPERRRQRGVGPEPQHFDVMGALPRHLRPASFYQLHDDEAQILQYLRGVEGMSGKESRDFLGRLELELRNVVGH